MPRSQSEGGEEDERHHSGNRNLERHNSLANRGRGENYSDGTGNYIRRPDEAGQEQEEARGSITRLLGPATPLETEVAIQEVGVVNISLGTQAATEVEEEEIQERITWHTSSQETEEVIHEVSTGNVTLQIPVEDVQEVLTEDITFQEDRALLNMLLRDFHHIEAENIVYTRELVAQLLAAAEHEADLLMGLTGCANSLAWEIQTFYNIRDQMVTRQQSGNMSHEECRELMFDYYQSLNRITRIARFLEWVQTNLEEVDGALSNMDEDMDEDMDEEWEPIPLEEEEKNEVVRQAPSARDTLMVSTQFSEQDIEEGKGACTVCLENFAVDVSILQCPSCHQYFHENCILDCLRRTDNCILCRQSVVCRTNKQ